MSDGERLLRELMEAESAEQRRQWDEHTAKARAKGECEFSGLPIHSCHRTICDCFDAWDCKACLP